MMKLSLLSLSLVGYAQASASIYDSLLHCLSTSGVPQVYPNTTDFAQTIVPYNVRLNFTPVAYTFSTTVPQVQSAVSCASNLSVKINPKSGGHSYASHSIGGEDGHLVIDLKYLYDVKVDPNTFIATIGPAARLGNIAIALFNQSGRALAHGLCPGIGGHALHGGQGYSSHNAGLLLDSLIEAELVTATGDVICASESENSDLFWALRGAGMSFGIVTSLKFQNFAAPSENILFYYPFLWNQTQALTAWYVWQEYCGGYTIPIIPLEMNVRLFIVPYYTGYVGWLLEGAYHGSEEDFLVAIAPLLDAFNALGGIITDAEIPGVGMHDLGWLDSLLYANNNDLLAGYGSIEQLETPLDYDPHSNFSLMTPNLSQNGSEAWINALYTYGFTNPSSVSYYILISAQGGPTSFVSQVPAASTSYAHRSSIHEWQFDTEVVSGDFPDSAITWLNAFVRQIEIGEVEKLGMYYNYAGPTLGKAEADWRYLGENYERLEGIKRYWDPDMVFLNPQSVGV